MGNVNGVNIERADYQPRIASNTRLFIGQKRSAVTCTGSGSSYTIDDQYFPIMDVNCDGEIDKDDIVMYEDGIEVAVTAFTITDSLDVTLESSASGVVTADIWELHEAISAQDWNLSAKPKELKWDQVGSDQEITIYSGSDDTFEINLKSVSPDFAAMQFDDTTGEKTNSPPEVAFAIVYEPRDAGEDYWGYYCPAGDLVFDTVSKGKAMDMTDEGCKISLRDSLYQFKDLDEYITDAGIEPT